jgi:DNA-binding response OmpR family regulator
VSPLREPDDSVPPSPSPPPVASPRPTRVLVVDDSPLVRRLAVRIFQERPDLEPVLARDGAEALAIFADDPPAVAVIDLDLPGVDGLELVQDVRRRHGHVPVILMTAHGSEEIAVQALRAGAANYVPKKNLVHELLETIDRVLSVLAVDRHRRRTMSCLSRRESLFEMENDPNLVTPLSNLLQEELHATGFCDRTTCVRIGVALTEALTNALFHGNLEVSSELREDEDDTFFALAEQRRSEPPYSTRRIHVRATLDRESVTYVIRDEGPGFEHRQPSLADDARNVTRIGGRGLLLIRSFMDEVTFNEPGNEIVLFKHRGTRGEKAEG